MKEYTFDTLNDYDFELLVRDLFNRREQLQGTNIVFQSFKKGKDQGIDLLYSSIKYQFEIVVQIKHYIETPLSTLINQLNTKSKSRPNSEYDKIKQIKPNRFILVTSKKLSLSNKAAIQKMLSPYIKGPQDIYGREDINALLIQFTEIKEQHFKLWFNDTLILKNILNNGIKGRSDFLKSEIEKKVKLYARTKSYDEASKILTKENILIIKGLPGVGKTSLAEMLIYQLLGDGAYQLVEITDSIKEAENIIDNKTNKLIYFDDFLGANYHEIINSRKNESSLLRFIKRIAREKNHKFILTTRISVLNQAYFESEKFARTISSVSNFEVDLGQITVDEKRLIFLNHLKASNSYSRFIEEVVSYEDTVNEIVSHPNFNPRIIEYISLPDVSEVQNGKHIDFISTSLDNPDKIWEHAYFNQIGSVERMFLSTLFLFDEELEVKTLEKAFLNRIKYEVKSNNYLKTNFEFRQCIKTLDNSFIKLLTYEDGSCFIEFINPSLLDFLFYVLQENKEELKEMIKSYYFIEQLSSRFINIRHSLLRVLTKSELKPLLLNHEDVISTTENVSLGYVKYIIILNEYFDLADTDIKTRIINTCDKIEFENFYYDIDDKFEMFELFECIIQVEELKDKKYNWQSLFLEMIKDESEIDDLGRIYSYIIQVEYDLNEFYNQNKQIISQVESSCLLDIVEEFIYDHEENIKDLNAVDDLIRKTYKSMEEFYLFLLSPLPSIESIFYEIDWESKIEKNKIRDQY